MGSFGNQAGRLNSIVRSLVEVLKSDPGTSRAGRLSKLDRFEFMLYRVLIDLDSFSGQTGQPVRFPNNPMSKHTVEGTN